MRKEVRIAGFGGQGVISIGVLLARALGQFGDFEVAQTQSYGPEARGGACKTDVVISDETIDYIKPLGLDHLVAMSQPAFDAYSQTLPDDALVVVDSTLVHSVPERFTNVFRIPALEVADTEFKMNILGSAVMFGALLGLTGWGTPEQGKQAIMSHLPAKVHEKNCIAFDKGFALGAEKKSGQ